MIVAGWSLNEAVLLLTGNDLARVLRWGAGYTGGEDPLNLLRDVIDAEEIKLDRCQRRCILRKQSYYTYVVFVGHDCDCFAAVKRL